MKILHYVVWIIDTLGESVDNVTEGVGDEHALRDWYPAEDFSKRLEFRFNLAISLRLILAISLGLMIKAVLPRFSEELF